MSKKSLKFTCLNLTVLTSAQKTDSKAKILEGELDEVFDFLEAYLEKNGVLLLNDLLLLRARHRRIQKDQLAGVLDYSTYQTGLNALVRELVYFIDQVPAASTTGQPIEHKRRKGKVLHDIPSSLPLQKLTKCIIRIGETEELVLEDFQSKESTVIEEISIGKDMAVELFELGNGGNFEILSINSAAQSVDSFEATQWLFYVRPLKEGTHLLFLKISIVHQVDGKELTKETVLEHQVKVTTEVPEAVPERSWHSTNVYVAHEGKFPFPSPPSPPRSAAIPSPSSNSATEIEYTPLIRESTNEAKEPAPGYLPSSPAKLVLPKRQRALMTQLFIFAGLGLAFAASVVVFHKPILRALGLGKTVEKPGDGPVINPDTTYQLKQLKGTNDSIESERRLPEGTKVEPIDGPSNDKLEQLGTVNDKVTPAIKKAPKNEGAKIESTSPESAVPQKKEQLKSGPPKSVTDENTPYRISCRVMRQQTIPFGQTISIGVNTEGFEADKLRFSLNNSAVLRPVRQQDNYLFFELRSSENNHQLRIEDLKSGTSHAQDISGSSNSLITLRKMDL